MVAQQTNQGQYQLLKQLNQLQKFIGNTPLYPISRVWSKPGVQVYTKLEWYQLGGSIKSRPAFHIIKAALTDINWTNGKRLLDATSGNTGIAYAAISSALGLPLTLCIPENASKERIDILRSHQTDLVFTSRFEGTDGAQEVAKRMQLEKPEEYILLDQYSNCANWQAHIRSTAPEIWAQTQGQVTHFVAGLGTTGTVTGTSKGLKAFNPRIKVIGLQPDSPMHGLEGWKHLETAIIPPIYKPQAHDELLEINTEEAIDLMKKVAIKEGLQISPSSAANLLGAIKVAEKLSSGTVVTTFADDASKYREIWN